jgi:hypothetical protein
LRDSEVTCEQHDVQSDVRMRSIGGFAAHRTFSPVAVSEARGGAAAWSTEVSESVLGDGDLDLFMTYSLQNYLVLHRSEAGCSFG